MSSHSGLVRRICNAILLESIFESTVIIMAYFFQQKRWMIFENFKRQFD